MDKITIVFSVDTTYFPYLCVAVQSIMENASRDLRYEIVVLQSDLSARTRAKLERQVSEFSNFSLNFLDVSNLASEYGLDKLRVRKRFRVSAYYRLLIAHLLPNVDKVVYLDCDLAVLCDIAELFKVELGDNLLAAVEDRGVLTGWVKDPKFIPYLNGLGMKDVSWYFNSGVIVMNLAEIRRRELSKVFFDVARRNTCYFMDQNVLNVSCEGRVVHLDYEWNVQLSNPVEEDAPLKIIHYCGVKKPWMSFSAQFADEWWRYARKTAMYEKMLFETVRRQFLPVTSRVALVVLKFRVLIWKYIYRISFGRMRLKLKERYKDEKMSYDTLVELSVLT